ncbi:MAG TPA: hypothetical protein VN764_06365, partial [Polyangiaceae bacterium]|nr:hypothetical protein [Polyangiaceae bacterium]
MVSLLHFLRSRRLSLKLYALASCAGLFIVSCGLDRANRSHDQTSSGDDGTGGRTEPQDGTGGQHSGGTVEGPLGGADGTGGDQGDATGAGGDQAVDPEGSGGDQAVDPAAFITRWTVEGQSSALDNDEDLRTVSLPLIARGQYDFVVDWGDGTS